MKNRKIYCLGNTLFEQDSLPVRLMPDLKRSFPDMSFESVDPTENFIPEDKSILIDTVEGIKEITVFPTLEKFEDSARVSVHDYDLLLHLKLLKKINILPHITIIGIPSNLSIKLVLKPLIFLIPTL